ncbi:MAG: hypothetical protein KF902_01020 [Phycisphaeraceae bacterium]|nr:hypothetical protein [Phycisphaeraceae bacterium]MCW5767821.1 hypothetical protein [Phycisphaeraceae bacterium]
MQRTAQTSLVMATLLASGPASNALALTPPTNDRPALAGPVPTRPAAPTLVDLRYDGSLRELDASPEEAAISRMNLSSETRRRVDAVIAARQSFFDRVLSRNLMLLLEIDAAQKAEDKLTIGRLSFDLLAHFEPLRHEPTLRAQLRDVLTPGERETFDAMLDAYTRAFDADLRAKAEREGGRIGTLQIAATYAGVLFTRDIERSINRLELSGHIAFEYVLAQLQLAPEDAERARKAAAPFLGVNPGGMTEKDHGLAFLAVAAHLTEKQRQRLAEILAGF